MNRTIGQVLVVLAALCWGSAHASPVIVLTPDSVVAGQGGDTVGWGYSFTNDTGFYLLVDGSNFCGIGGDPFFTDCTTPYNPPTSYGPAYGVYTDYIAANATVIAPNSTATVSFDPFLQTGVGQYVINPSPTNVQDVGNLFVSFQEFNGDPFAGGTQASGDIEIFASAEVDSIPEPATVGLAAGALLMLLGLRKRRPAS